MILLLEKNFWISHREDAFYNFLILRMILAQLVNFFTLSSLFNFFWFSVIWAVLEVFNSCSLNDVFASIIKLSCIICLPVWFNFLAAWDCSAWVRTYALFLEERLECFRILKYDIEAERLPKPAPGQEKVISLISDLYSFVIAVQIFEYIASMTLSYVD